MKKLIAIALLLVFLVQIIPVKEVGKLLTSGQMTEELQHDGSAKKQNPNEEVHKKLFFHSALIPSSNANLRLLTGLQNTNEQARINTLLLEVLIQPPDNSKDIA